MPSERANRIDPENSLGIDFHAARALMRKGKDGIPEFENFDSAARRAAIQGAAFRNEGVHLGEADKMRKAMLRVLDRLEGRRTPEQEQLLQLLSQQIEPALGVWQDKPGIDMKDAPTEAVIQAWLGSLAEQTLDGMLEYKEPRLVVVPPVLTTQLLEMIGGRNYWLEGWNDVKAPRWKFGVTDGIEDLDDDLTIFFINPDEPEDEYIKRTNEQMVLEYKRRLQAKGQDIMPPYAYVPAAATVMAQGKLLDRRNWTAFERRGTSDMLRAGFGNNHVGLGAYDPEDSDGYLHCRPWVEGE